MSTATAATPQPASNPVLGATLLTIAFLAVAIMSAFGKAATHVSTGIIVFFQNAISLLLFLPWVLRGGISGVKTHRWGMHIVRAVTGLLSQALMFLAVKHMPLMNAVLLANSAPLFIPVLSWAWLRQRVSGIVWVSVLVGFAGIVLILHPSSSILQNPAALLATAAAAFSAVALVTVNQLSSTDSTERILFYYFLISSLASAPFAVHSWSMPSTHQWLLLTGIGVFMAASQLLIILAYRQATAERIAPFNYSVVVFSGLIGWLVWHNTPGLLAVAGVVLVTLGGVLSTKFGGSGARGHFGWIGHWNMQRHASFRESSS
jgi:drug/metabolite transporter (DMT)-like permease